MSVDEIPADRLAVATQLSLQTAQPPGVTLPARTPLAALHHLVFQLRPLQLRRLLFERSHLPTVPAAVPPAVPSLPTQCLTAAAAAPQAPPLRCLLAVCPAPLTLPPMPASPPLVQRLMAEAAVPPLPTQRLKSAATALQALMQRRLPVASPAPLRLPLVPPPPHMLMRIGCRKLLQAPALAALLQRQKMLQAQACLLPRPCAAGASREPLPLQGCHTPLVLRRTSAQAAAVMQQTLARLRHCN